MRKIVLLMVLIFVFSSGCSSYRCARKYKVLHCYGDWGVNQQSAQFKKDRRLCAYYSKGCRRFGAILMGFGQCYPERDIRAMEECYQDCMERRGYKLQGLSDKMLNTPSFN